MCEWKTKFAWLPTKMGVGNRSPIVFFKKYRERVSQGKIERLFNGQKYKVIIA